MAGEATAAKLPPGARLFDDAVSHSIELSGPNARTRLVNWQSMLSADQEYRPTLYLSFSALNSITSCLVHGR